MFFLGGFNTIIPYLLYLSLIWVFVIIGFHGKINEVWHALNPTENYAEPVNAQLSVYTSVLDSQTNADQQQDTFSEPSYITYSYLKIELCIGTILPDKVAIDIPCWSGSFTLRGPPVLPS